MQLHLVITIVLTIYSYALHIDHKQTNQKYNATNYLTDLQARQQQFNKDIQVIKQQIASINKVLNSSTLTPEKRLSTLSEGMADQRDTLFTIEKYLYNPFEIQPCKEVNLTDDQRDKLQQQIDKVSKSLQNMEAQVDFCPQCPQIQQIKKQVAKEYNYLKAIQATVHSGCLQRPYEFVNQSATGIANIANSLYKDNLKGKNWVYGNITQQDYKLYLFKQSTQYNLTSCPAATPYVDVNQKMCTACGGIYNIGERKCYPCPDGQHFNSTVQNCVEDPKVCTNGTVLNVSINKCQPVVCGEGLKVDLNTSKCVSICNTSSFYNTTSKACELTPLNCTSDYYYNTTTRKCQTLASTCVEGYYYNTTNKRCQLQIVTCTSGYFYNTTTHKCQIIVCGQNQVYDTASKVCIDKVSNTVSMCPPQKPLWNSTVFQCQVCPSNRPNYKPQYNRCDACPSNKVFNDQTNQCESMCQQGQAYNTTTKTCQLDCPGTQTYNTETKQCECPAGQVLDLQTSTCSIECPAGSILNSTSKTCQVICPSGQYYNKTSKFCQSPKNCAPGSKFNMKTGQCDSICSAGQVFNLATQSCQIQCRPNSSLEKQSNRCVCNIGFVSNGTDCIATNNTTPSNVTTPLCSQPTPYLNPSTNKCQPCPTDKPNYSPVAKQCLPPCPPAYTWNSVTANCEKVTCSSDKPVLNYATGKCEACPGNSVWNSSAKACQSSTFNYTCQTGFFFNTATQKCQTTTCPDDYHYNLVTNKCQKCPDGSNYNFTLGKCFKCPDGSVYDLTLKTCNLIKCDPGQYFSMKSKACKDKQICDPSVQYFSQQKQACVNYPTCGDYQVFNKTTLVCQPAPTCPAGQYYNKKTLKCERADFLTSPSAPNLIYAYNFTNYTNQYDTKKATDPYARDCPQGSAYSDLNKKVCVSCPKDTPYFNLHTSLCQSCGNAGYDATLRMCKSEGVVNNPTLERLIMNIL